MKMKAPIALALAVILASAGLSGCSPKAKSAPPLAPSRTVSVVLVQPHAIEGGLIAAGALLPREDAAIFSDVSGYRVARVVVDEGSWVKAGEALVQLDDTLIRAQIDQQSALAEQLRVQAERAEAEAARVKDLDGEGVLSQEQLDARRFAARAARAQSNAQAAAVRDLRTRQAHLTVRAPYAGLVIERNVRVGEMSGGGGTTPWFRIAKDGEVELAADVNESALSRLRPGTPADVTLADGSHAPGKVRLVSPRVDSGTKLGKVRIALPVSGAVRAGGFAKAAFSGVATAQLAVPETAIRYDADGAAVMVVGPDNRVSRVAVTTGQHGGGFVELVTGPPAGTRVAAKYGTMLVAGDVVRPVPASQPTASR
jgi:HlyD family secretion protein